MKEPLELLEYFDRLISVLGLRHQLVLEPEATQDMRDLLGSYSKTIEVAWMDGYSEGLDHD